MASRERESTGMTLISSMYSDDEDDEMEDVPDPSTSLEEADKYTEPLPTAKEDLTMLNDEEMVDSGRERDATPLASSAAIPVTQSKSQRLTPQQTLSPSQEEAVPVDYRSKKARLAIVEYGQDEVAMSPEAEDGEIMVTAGVVGSEELQTENSEIQGSFVSETSQVLTVSTHENGQLSAQLNPSLSDNLSNAVCEAEFSVHVEVVTIVEEDQAEVDPLNTFLPPPPPTKCSEELQKRINKFLDLKRGGKSYNAEVRNKKEYRNPDFLVHAVTYQDIDQIGSCFSKDVFDPHGYDKSDFYDEIEADMKREMERKEQERKKSQKIEYVSGGVQQPVIVMPSPKLTIAVGAGSGLPTVPASSTDAAVGGREGGRQSKKSKWDKVDSEKRNPLPPGGGGGDPFAAGAGAHAATFLSSANANANAGSGYTAFAQQRRKEAEEKRSSDRRERRT
ncbi:uncharacterized protein LOC124916435 [Impatiens glandulifera]|uniref:uncharacterized protein LOC124916435 n=1 Tax=Impatiens glandulifera TaxID=253017 RepID=UPI001FB173C4|nr:uncharacterized protein LOC124916435 [Impatiens glandulifera]